MIECKNVVHAFGARTVLHDVSFTVPRGAVFGFIGPNGAGKTTTIRILATLLAPTSGTVTVAGHDVVEDPESVRRVLGYMPDTPGVYERITAREYLEFFASACGIEPSRRARAIDNVVELAEVSALLPHEVMALSKGQRQRLLLARTLLHDPSVLVLDEPASDLDPRARIELRMLLTELARMGKTIFLSSHILTELADLCGWIGVIERGRVVASGPVEAVQARLRPGRRVDVAVLARGSEARGALEGCAGVTAVASDAEVGDGAARFTVDFEGDDAAIAAMVAALAARSVPVVAVRPEGRDLERIFMDLTRRST